MSTSGDKRIQECSCTAGGHGLVSRQPGQQTDPIQSKLAYVCPMVQQFPTTSHRFIKGRRQDAHCRVIQRGRDLEAIWVSATQNSKCIYCIGKASTHLILIKMKCAGYCAEYCPASVTVDQKYNLVLLKNCFK